MAYLVRLTDLEEQAAVIVAKENADRALIRAFAEMTVESPAFASFNAGLIRWATAGFPDVYPVYSISFNPPSVCSDGVSRPDLMEYINYLGEPNTIADHMAAIDVQLDGMSLSYSYSASTIVFHVRKS